jgi:hypothetical protein
VQQDGTVDVGTSKGGHFQNRWGGLYERAASGLLREAAVYPPTGPAAYAFAEPATGGEAFVPKHGNAARSLTRELVRTLRCEVMHEGGGDAQKALGQRR